MAEGGYQNQYDDKEVRLPCEFCGFLFHIDEFALHESGCKGKKKEENVPEKPLVVTERLFYDDGDDDDVVRRQALRNYGKVPGRKSSSFKIQQIVTHDVFDMKKKEEGGYLLKKAFIPKEDKNIPKTEKLDIISDNEHRHSDGFTDNKRPSSEVVVEQSNTIESDWDKPSSEADVEESYASDDEASELSDDNNDENENIEHFIQKAFFVAKCLLNRNYA